MTLGGCSGAEGVAAVRGKQEEEITNLEKRKIDEHFDKKVLKPLLKGDNDTNIN